MRNGYLRAAEAFQAAAQDLVGHVRRNVPNVHSHAPRLLAVAEIHLFFDEDGRAGHHGCGDRRHRSHQGAWGGGDDWGVAPRGRLLYRGVVEGVSCKKNYNGMKARRCVPWGAGGAVATATAWGRHRTAGEVAPAPASRGDRGVGQETPCRHPAAAAVGTAAAAEEEEAPLRNSVASCSID